MKTLEPRFPGSTRARTTAGAITLAVLGAIAGATSSGATAAQEGKVDTIHCASWTLLNFQHREGALYGTFDGFGTIQGKAPGGGPLDDASFQCSGGWRLVDGKYWDGGSCEYFGKNGDRMLIRHESIDLKGTYTILSGTGKWAGITGQGEYERRPFYPVTRPNTFAMCYPVRGSYRLP